MVYIRDAIVSKIMEVKYNCPDDAECLFVELKFKECK